MKIVVRKEKAKIKVGDCAVGSLFKYNEKYFIRCDSSLLAEAKKCVDVSSGIITDFQEGILVVPVDAEIVIK